jgi:hypothetical protein
LPTGRNFRARYKEHIQAIRSNKANSKYTQHILNTHTALWKTQWTSYILKKEKKGPLMNTLECFHIYNLSKDNLQMNDTYADTHNPIFNLIKEYYTPPTNPIVPLIPPTTPHSYKYTNKDNKHAFTVSTETGNIR